MAAEDDPRWELIRQLIEYKKFKEAAADSICVHWNKKGSLSGEVPPDLKQPLWG